MDIRLILATAMVLGAATISTSHAQQVQIVIGNPGCRPFVVSRPICNRPVFVNPIGFCGPTQIIVTRPTRMVFLSSSPAITSGSPVLPPPIRLGAYRAPVVSVNTVQSANGFTWRR